jgi:Flp pilus assembly protein TadG
MLDKLRREESGAVLVLVTLLMAALLLLAGLIIDMGGVRTYRANNQLISDAAASAGALAAASTGNGQEACHAAKDYVILNTPDVSSLAGIDCSTFPMSCTAGTPDVVASDTENGYTVTISYPVGDGSSFMTSKLTGAPAQPTSGEDGEACERVAVGINSEWEATFTQLAGYDSFAADVHTVAKANLPSGESVPINLLVLDRFGTDGCTSLEAGGNGGIFVRAILNPDNDGDPSNGLTPELIQGVAAADSDASAGCGSAVINVSGANPIIRADGPAGCSNQTGMYSLGGLTAGEGCGRVQTLAPGTPGCNFPACSPGGGTNTPNPDPTALPARLTRAPVDHRYNCQAGYDTLDPALEWATSALKVGNEQDIDDCADAASNDPHIHDLIRDVGETGWPTGFTNQWTDTYSCTTAASDPPISVIGDWWVDCPGPGFRINSTVVFADGNVVFDGDVDIRSDGALAVVNTSASPGWVFLRDGELKKAGQASLTLAYTMVYASETSSVSLSGGNSGSLTWIAPASGDFDDLALWSDSAEPHRWAGQANLDMEGVFFTPLALTQYTGQGSQLQVNAQFIADKLSAGGQGILVVAPEFTRAVQFPVEPQSILIR